MNGSSLDGQTGMIALLQKSAVGPSAFLSSVHTLLAASFLVSGTALGQAAPIIEKYPFDVVLNVSWQGREVEIRKTLTCNKRHRLYPSTDGPTRNPIGDLRKQDVWDQDVSRIAHVFPSGEVLISHLPNVCDPRKKALREPKSGFLPHAYWVDNKDKPMEIEEILSERYFTQNPKRRFAIRRFAVEQAPSKPPKPDKDEIFIALADSPEHKYDALFFSVKALAFPQPVWSRYPDLARQLNRYKESGPVDFELIRGNALPLLESCTLPGWPIGSADRCSSEVDDREYAFGMTQRDNVWVIDYADVGVARHVRYATVGSFDTTGCLSYEDDCNVRKQVYRVQIDTQIYDFPVDRSPGFFFDVRSQNLVRIRAGLTRSTAISEDR